MKIYKEKTRRVGGCTPKTVDLGDGVRHATTATRTPSTQYLDSGFSRHSEEKGLEAASKPV